LDLDHDLYNQLSMLRLKRQAKTVDDQLPDGLLVIYLFLKIVHVAAIASLQTEVLHKLNHLCCWLDT